MRLSRDAVVDRVVEALFDHERAIGDALADLQEELRRRDQEDTARAKQAARDNQPKYGLVRYESATKQNESGGYDMVNRPAEYLAITESDIPHFTRAHKLPIDELWRVLRGERLEVGGWRSWDSPSWSASRFFDVRAEERKEMHEDLLALDRKEEAGRKLRAGQAARVLKPGPVLPAYSEYTIGKDK